MYKLYVQQNLLYRYKTRRSSILYRYIYTMAGLYMDVHCHRKYLGYFILCRKGHDGGICCILTLHLTKE